MNKLFFTLIAICIFEISAAQDTVKTKSTIEQSEGLYGEKNGIPDLGNPLQIDNRKVVFKPKVKFDYNWGEGLAWVRVQLNEEGLITKAKFVLKAPKGMSNISPNPKQRLVAENCAKKYKFEPSTKKGEVTGYIPIRFRLL